MRLDQLSVALRPRTPWEAMDLGVALVRQHAAAVWKPWFALTAPAFLVCNLLAWAIGPLWFAALAMWWLKPLFDRVPLYVLSRAVFGAVPDTRQVLRAPQVWAPGQLAAWLSWRRLDPSRALRLPVDLLEGPRGSVRRERVRVLGQAVQAPAWGLTFVGSGLEIALFSSVFFLALLIASPTLDMLPDSLRLMAVTFFETPPAWAQLCVNAVSWLAMGAIEPFYVGAGFGMYLSRRTQLEAWDVELAFRRLAERAQALAGGAALALLVAVTLAFAPVDAAYAQEKDAAPTAKEGNAKAEAAAPVVGEEEDEDEEDVAAQPPTTVRALVGDDYRTHDDAFARSVARAYRDPKLSKRLTEESWVPRNRDKSRNTPPTLPAWLAPVAWIFSLVGEFGLWIIAGALLAFLLWKAPAWLPWVRELRQREDAPTPVVEHADVALEPLPDDVPTAVRALWRSGEARAALALLYRASVERLAAAQGRPLPPGATEAECLRRSRALPDAPRAAFAQVVRAWQAIAYAHRRPDGAALEELLTGWQQAFGARA